MRDQDDGLSRFFPELQNEALHLLASERVERTEGLVGAEHNVFGDFGDAQQLYFGGDMNAAISLTGEVAGRIESVRPVAEIIADTVAEFRAAAARLS